MVSTRLLLDLQVSLYVAIVTVCVHSCYNLCGHLWSWASLVVCSETDCVATSKAGHLPMLASVWYKAVWKIEGRHFNSSSACVISNIELYTSTEQYKGQDQWYWTPESHYQHVIILSTCGHIINMWSYYQHVVTVQEISALQQLSTLSDVCVYSLTNTSSSIQTHSQMCGTYMYKPRTCWVCTHEFIVHAC